jgi:hypothetical protein
LEIILKILSAIGNFINSHFDILIGVVIGFVPTYILDKNRFKQELKKLDVARKQRLLEKLESKAERIMASSNFYQTQVEEYKEVMKYEKLGAETYLVPVSKEFTTAKYEAAIFLHIYFPDLIDKYNLEATSNIALSGFVIDCAKKNDFSDKETFKKLVEEYYSASSEYNLAIISSLEKERMEIKAIIDQK